MRKAMTLIEVIFTLVIASILIVGTSTMLKNLSLSVQKTKQLTDLSLDTQSALNQIASLLYYRVPNSAIGYNGINEHASVRASGYGGGWKVLEWFGSIHEAGLNNHLSSFIDMEDSNFTTKTLLSPNSNFNQVNTLVSQKLPTKTIADTAIVFAGGLDMGAGAFQKSGASRTSFGWHGDGREDVFSVSGFMGDTINIAGANQPTYIYEKFYLVDTAYAIARFEHVDKNSPCLRDHIEPDALNLTNEEKDNLLLLFYDYRPWNGETFCADRGARGVKGGKVTLLSAQIDGFRADYVNFTIRITLDAKERLRGSKEVLHVTKQKVVF